MRVKGGAVPLPLLLSLSNLAVTKCLRRNGGFVAGRIRRRAVRFIALVIGMVVLGQLSVAAPSAVADSALPWTGGVSASVATTATDANAPSTMLTVILSAPLADPYGVSVYDDLGHRLYYSYNPGYSTFALSVAPETNATRTYTAYVALDSPSAGPPVSDVRAASNAVTVHNDGYTGTVSVKVGTTTTDANTPSTIVTMTLSKPLPEPYVLSLYDDLGNRISYMANPGYASYSVWVTPETNATRTYTAYVAQDAPSAGPPSNDVKTTGALTVVNLGWLGSLTMSVSGTSPVTLTMTLSKPLPEPYVLSVYDVLGNRVYYNTNPGYTTYSVLLTPPTTGTWSYTAYVAQEDPSGRPPALDVREAVTVGFTDGVVSSGAQDGIDLDVLAASLTSLEPDAVEALVAAAPGTHIAESSLTDQQIAYEGARQTGQSIREALAAAAASAGTAGGWLLYLWTQTHTLAPPPEPPVTSQPVPATPSTSPYPTTQEPTYEDNLTAALLVRNPNVSEQQARMAARECISMVQYAIGGGALPASVNGKYPCDAFNLYLPGSEYPSTTDHDYQAIFGNNTTGNSSRIGLHYVSQADKVASGLDRSWARLQPECAGLVGGTTGNACDEYPFFASAESGPGASLQPLSTSENRGAGGRYGVFVSACQLVSGGPSGPTQTTGTPFLVLPMNFAAAPRTMHFCTS